jgi:hypothetical protein
MSTLGRIFLSIAVGVVAFLICMFVGGALATVDISWVAFAGEFFVRWASLIGLLVAVIYFFSGRTWPWRNG